MVKGFEYYKQCFENLSVNKKGGQLAPHKPLLLLAVIDLVECGIVKSPKIELNEALIAVFKINETRYTRNIVHFKPNIGMPFYHMSAEPFWRLLPKIPGTAPCSYAISTIRKFYKCAEIEPELFELIKDPTSCKRLRQILIKSYLQNRTDKMQSLSPIVLLASWLCQLIA